MLLPDILVIRIRVPDRSVIKDHALARPDHVVKCGLGESRRNYGHLSNSDLDSAVAGGGFRRDPRLAAPQKDEQATLGARMLYRDPHEGLDELAEFDLARHRLRCLDHCPDVQLVDGEPIVAVGGDGAAFSRSCG